MKSRALTCAIIAVGLALAGPILVAESASAAPASAIPGAVTSISPVTTTPIATGDLLTLQGTWAVPDGSAPGDTFELQLPAELKWFGRADFDLKDPAGAVIATGHADASGAVVFTLSDYVTSHPIDLHGTFTFTTQYTTVQTEAGPETLTFSLGGTVLTVPIEDAGPPAAGTGPTLPPTAITQPFKWAWWSDTTTQDRIDSLLSSPTLTAPAATLTITDTPAAGLALDCSSLTAAVGTTFDTGWRVSDDLAAAHPPTVSCSATSATVTWNDLPAGATAQVAISANVTDASRTSFTNNGSIVIDGVAVPVTTAVAYEGASGDGSGDGAVVTPPTSSPTPTPTPTSTPTIDAPTAGPPHGHDPTSGNETGAGRSGSGLAFTGADSTGPLQVATLLLALGMIVVIVVALQRRASRRI